ncbi:MAG: hypothetical protein ACM3PV_14765 [Betaproteobacteria bacterium]
MTLRQTDDGIEVALATLREHDADRERVERIRERCLAALASQRRRGEARVTRATPWRGWLEPALAFGVGAVYLAAAVVRALAAYR